MNSYPMSPESVFKIVQNEKIAAELLVGISSHDLSWLFKEIYVGESPEQLAVRKMNAIGSLRPRGYTVTGGRGGGDEYKITSFSEPVITKIEWSRSEQPWLEWFDSLDDISSGSWSDVFHALASRSPDDLRHENTWLYAWCYEAVGHRSNRAHLKMIEYGGTSALIKRTFIDRPRFSIIDLNLEPIYLLHLVQKLSAISLAPVKVVNPSLRSLDLLGTLKGRFEYVEQPIYPVKEIAETPEKFFSKQSFKTAKKMLREIEWCILAPDTYSSGAKTVIDNWREDREGSQARPAILRDYVSIEPSPRRLAFVGWRYDPNGDQYPVSYRVQEQLANNQCVASDLVEKSTNKSNHPGGHSGISDASLIFACRRLLSLGITSLNGGESASVGPLLTAFKHKYQSSSTRSITFVADGIPHKMAPK